MSTRRSRSPLPWLALTWALLGAAVASAQSADVPAGPARVEGRLVHADRPEPVANREVVLYALWGDGSAGLRATRSDADGRFAFEGISNQPDVIYLVGARAGEVPFGKRFRFESGATLQELVLEFSDPIPDTAAASPGGASLQLEPSCVGLRVEHVHRVRNPGERVIFVPESERAGARPVLEVGLPAGAEGFESLLDRSGLDREGDRLRFWGPLYPGEQELVFAYHQPLAPEGRGRLEIGFPLGSGALEVEAAGEALSVTSPQLDPRADGGPASRLGATSIEPGERLQLDVRLQARDAETLGMTRAEVWLELDDAALEVNERLEVVASEALAEASAPRLCLTLPPGARALRFGETTLGAGLRRDGSGALALHGPLPAGTSQLALSYRLPASPGGARFAARFDRELPLFSLLVADTGLVAETERLHRRRPIRAEDRVYLHWEAFGVEAGEDVEIALRPLPARRGAGSWASAGFALLAGLASLGFLIGPLRAGAPEHAAPEGRRHRRGARAPRPGGGPGRSRGGRGDGQARRR